MATIVLGVASSHGPMLSTPPDQWGQRVAADRKNTKHAYRGGTYDFERLAALRADEKLAGEITPERWRERHARCQAALAELQATYAECGSEAAVIFGNDQRELFVEDNLPAFAVYWGETIENIPSSDDQRAMLPPGIAVAEAGHCPPEGATYPGLPSLGRHLIESLIADGFDVAQSTTLPRRDQHWSSGIPHAYGFLYRQVMRDEVVPNVPVFINTFYPPNQPSAARCWDLGLAVARAIESWPDERRVALLASGGLSHFVIDEEVDRAVLAAMQANDRAALADVPADRFRSGTSEIKNWIPLAAAMGVAGLTMDLVDYVPCYRSEAGTGNAMGFARWRR